MTRIVSQQTGDSSRWTMVLLPKEHGAYGQMAFPLITSLLAFGVTTASLLWVLAVVGAFVAHEPLLVLLGRRGQRLRRDRGRQASLVFAVVSIGTVVAAGLALWQAPPHVHRTFLLPLLPAGLVAVAVVKGLEKSWHGEVAVAATFSLAAVPAAMSAGADMRSAFAISTTFLVLFVAGTLAVRVVILRVRAGGSRKAVRTARLSVVAVAVTAALGLSAAGWRGVLPWTPLAAVAPGVILALWLTAFPPPAQRLRAVGWSLVTASTLSSLLLIVGL